MIVPPGMTERILRGAGYLTVGATGALVIAQPPNNISSALGQALTIVWACFMLTAIPAAISAATGLYRGEYAALPWFTGGLLVALLHLWFETPGDPHLIPRALLMTALLLVYVVRFVTLHRLVGATRKGGWWTRTR